ncbi:MAG: T9SS type A sorting domain-containing protein [Bacteroidales bacterium]
MIIVFFWIGFLDSQNLCAQEAILPLGNNLEGQGGGVSYSIGQIASHQYHLPEIHIFEGVQQSYESVAVGLPPTETINIRYIVYPNPTSGIAYLEVKLDKMNGLHYHLHDLNGREIASAAIRQHISLLPTSSLPPGTYILRVSQKQQTRKLFKIIKHP